MNERISREEVVKIYDIEIAFFDELEAVGLIQTEVIDQTTYLHYNLLDRIRLLQDENKRLSQGLR